MIGVVRRRVYIYNLSRNTVIPLAIIAKNTEEPLRGDVVMFPRENSFSRFLAFFFLLHCKKCFLGTIINYDTDSYNTVGVHVWYYCYWHSLCVFVRVGIEILKDPGHENVDAYALLYKKQLFNFFRLFFLLQFDDFFFSVHILVLHTGTNYYTAIMNVANYFLEYLHYNFCDDNNICSIFLRLVVFFSNTRIILLKKWWI